MKREARGALCASPMWAGPQLQHTSRAQSRAFMSSSYVIDAAREDIYNEHLDFQHCCNSDTTAILPSAIATLRRLPLLRRKCTLVKRPSPCGSGRTDPRTQGSPGSRTDSSKGRSRTLSG